MLLTLFSTSGANAGCVQTRSSASRGLSMPGIVLSSVWGCSSFAVCGRYVLMRGLRELTERFGVEAPRDGFGNADTGSGDTNDEGPRMRFAATKAGGSSFAKATEDKRAGGGVRPRLAEAWLHRRGRGAGRRGDEGRQSGTTGGHRPPLQFGGGRRGKRQSADAGSPDKKTRQGVEGHVMPAANVVYAAASSGPPTTKARE